MPTTYISDKEIIEHLPKCILEIEKNKRVVITRKNSPIAALVNISDLKRLEQQENKEKGLASVIGKWNDFDEILDDISSIRNKGGIGRDVSF